MCGILCQQTNLKSASPGTGVAESQSGTCWLGCCCCKFGEYDKTVTSKYFEFTSINKGDKVKDV